MNIPKAILITLAAYLVKELLGMWVLFGLWFDIWPLERFSNFINKCFSLIVVIWFIKKVAGRESLRVQPTGLKFYLVALVLGAIFPFTQTGLNFIYTMSFELKAWNPEFHVDRLLDLSIISTILLSPIIEELVFRRYLQDGLQKTNKPWLAVLITSVLFSAFHINYFAALTEFGSYNLHQAYIVFFGSIMLGLLYLKSKSIGPPILMHIAWNLLANLT